MDNLGFFTVMLIVIFLGSFAANRFDDYLQARNGAKNDKV